MSWTLIESQTLGASAASVTLGSGGTIPQTYKTLKVVVSARTTSGADVTVVVRPNGATTNLSTRIIYGDGATTGSYTGTYAVAAFADMNGDTASTFGNSEMTIPNYAGSTNKPIASDAVTENNATTAYSGFTASLWSSTAAITSLEIRPNAAVNFAIGSTFTLYGLK